VFDLGSANIVVEKVADNDPEHDLVGRFLAVSFNVDDIDATYRKLLAKGVPFPNRRSGRHGVARLLFPRDPDGNIFNIGWLEGPMLRDKINDGVKDAMKSQEKLRLDPADGECRDQERGYRGARGRQEPLDDGACSRCCRR
jgi:hypothetical protein